MRGDGDRERAFAFYGNTAAGFGALVLLNLSPVPGSPGHHRRGAWCLCEWEVGSCRRELLLTGTVDSLALGPVRAHCHRLSRFEWWGPLQANCLWDTVEQRSGEGQWRTGLPQAQQCGPFRFFQWKGGGSRR